MLRFIVSCLLISSSLSAPQNFVARQALGAHNSQIVRSPFGTLSHHTKTVTDLDGSAVVHRHHTQLDNRGASVLRVSRPRLVQAGPFAVRAVPSATPFLVGGAGRNAPVITTAPAGVASNLFQTPDGRIFAFSNGNQPIGLNQLFQTPDGRIFSTSAIQEDNAAPAEADEPANNADAVFIGRQNTEEVIEEEPQEPLEEVQPQEVQQSRAQQQPAQQQRQNVVITQDNGLRSFVAVPSNQVISRAPIAALSHANHVVTHTDTPLTRFAPAVAHVAHPTVAHVAHPAAVTRTVAVPTTQGFNLADTASTGFFTFPGAGVAFQF